jgi:hypothetical protein
MAEVEEHILEHGNGLDRGTLPKSTTGVNSALSTLGKIPSATDSRPAA